MKINRKGYTLVEAVIAMGIFVAVVIPFMQYMHMSAKINRGKDRIIASSIIEQEAAILYSYPDKVFTIKQRQVNGKSWTIKASFQGNKLKVCKLEVYKFKKLIDKAVFYIYSES